jgi:hypothetical protein
VKGCRGQSTCCSKKIAFILLRYNNYMLCILNPQGSAACLVKPNPDRGV